MKTIALRFGDHFAPAPGTIAIHRQVIDANGYVWYGKLGTKISSDVEREILNNSDKKILLIHSGGAKRYWAYIDEITHQKPKTTEYPEYYGDLAEKMSTWFRITKIVEAPQNIMSQCIVTSSGALLSETSKHSMSPYFKITVKEV